MTLDDLRVDPHEPVLVDGPVWLTLGGREFPGQGWTDVVSSVLGSMGDAVAAALDGGAGDFYFFEGSYFVKLIPLSDVLGAPRRVRVVAVDDGHALSVDEGGEVLAEVVVSLCEIAERVSAAKERVRTWADARGASKVAEAMSAGYQYEASDPRFA